MFKVPPVDSWTDVAKAAGKESKNDSISLLSSAIAFWALLSSVPLLIVAVSTYGLVADPADITRQLDSWLATAPPEARTLIQDQLTSLTSADAGSLSFGVLAGVVGALWTASSGMKHLMTALTAVYDEQETRKFLKLRGLALLLTVGALLFLVIAVGAMTVLPAIARHAGLGAVGRAAVSVLRFVVLFVGFVVGASILYRFGPDRPDTRWQWITPGGVVAAVLWVVASLLFSVYTANFAHYNRTYGSLGGIVVLLLWLLISAATILFGAEVNSELERRATGRRRPRR